MQSNIADVVASTGFAVFIGALLGAIFGYVAQWHGSSRQNKARQAALFRSFHRQIEGFPFAPAHLDEHTVYSRERVFVSAVSQLLDGNTLDATKDADLIYLLSRWQSLEASNNDAIDLARLAALLPGVRAEERSIIYENVNERHRALREWRNHLRKLAPPDPAMYWAIGNVEDDYLSWGYPDGKRLALKRFLKSLEFWQRTRTTDWHVIDEILTNEDSAHSDLEHELICLQKNEDRHRQLMESRLETEIIPSLVALQELFQAHRRELRIGERNDKPYDPLNHGASGPGITSYSSTWVNIRAYSGDEFDLMVIAKSSPLGVTARIAGRQPTELGSRWGWSTVIANDIEAFTGANVVAAIMKRYEMHELSRRSVLERIIKQDEPGRHWYRY